MRPYASSVCATAASISSRRVTFKATCLHRPPAASTRAAAACVETASARATVTFLRARWTAVALPIAARGAGDQRDAFSLRHQRALASQLRRVRAAEATEHRALQHRRRAV